MEVNRNIGNLTGIANSLDHIGDIYLKKEDFDRALNYYLEAWKVIHPVDEKYRKSKILNHLGMVYTKQKKYDMAYEKLRQSLDIALETNAQDLKQETLQSMSEYYAARGNFEQAYVLLTQYTQLRDSIFTINSHHISEMQMRYETGKRDKENKLLKNKIEIQNLELEKSHVKTWLSFLSFILVSIVGFFSYHRYLSKKKANIVLENKIKEALNKQEEQQQIIFHQASLSSLGELAAGMAHEINQPLQNLKLCTESIQLEFSNMGVVNEQIEIAIKEIYHDIDRLKRLINHVRIFSSQQKSHVNELFHVNPVIMDALSLVSKQVMKKGIQIELDLKKNLGQLKGNPYKFEQVVINLLSNAKDAILEKQEKTGDFSKKIKVETHRKNKSILLRVIDNGIGIQKDENMSVFKPFYTTKKLGYGTGLGLSIVNGIVKEMSGTISLVSEYQKGTKIEVKIPKHTINTPFRLRKKNHK